MPLTSLPKALLHEHIEGSVTAHLTQILAQRHQVNLTSGFIAAEHSDYPQGRYAYDESDFAAFIQTYDTISSLIITPEDYYTVVYDFLSRNAQKGLIYCELISSPYHMCVIEEEGKAPYMDAARYHQIMDEIERAIAEIKTQYNLETRLHAVGVRHLGVENVMEVATFLQQNPREVVTGFNIAGDERAGHFDDFEQVHLMIDALGLGKSYHAGEICDSSSIKAALKGGATRIGHGIRAIDDADLIEQLIEHKVTLEIAVTSNRILVNELEGDVAKHPLRDLYNKGVRLSLNTDDAGVFSTDMGIEYQLAADVFGFSRVELLDITLCALECAFVDDITRNTLINRVYQAFNQQDIEALKQLLKTPLTMALHQRLTLRYQRLIAA